MSKVGRNDPCPCDSGKKYKNCHGSSQVTATSPSGQVSTQLTFIEMVSNYRAAPILKLLAYLQLLPENHGHNFSLEIMAREVMNKTSENDQRPYMPWNELLQAIKTRQEYDSETPINLFTENAVSVNGNQVIFPGVYRNASAILNELLQVILTGKNSLPEDFKRLVYSGAGLLLNMSNHIAEDLNYERYEPGNLSSKIALAEYDEFINNSQSLIFSEEYLGTIAELYNYDLSVIEKFILTTGDPKLKNDDPDDNIVSLKPLVRDDSNVLLYMPTTVVSSLIGFIYEHAEAGGCKDALMRMLIKEQNHRASMALSHLGWAFTNIKLPENAYGLPIRESIWQFDNQKFGYLCLLDIEKISENYTNEELEKLLNSRNTQVIEHLKSLKEAKTFEILSLFVLSETGHGSYFSMSKPENGEQSLVMTLGDLNTIAYDQESDFLTLWKFATIYKETSSRFRIINTNIKEKISLCDTIVTALIAELTRIIADFNAKELIEWLIKWNERCVYTREIREIRSPAKIACFANFEDEVNEINDKDGRLVPTAHSIRTLIEFIAATSPKGKKWPNYADVGILLALTHQLTTWGSISEAMRMGLTDPKMGLLPSGRIGTDKSFQNEVLIPYSYARNRGVVSRYVERFDEKYIHKYQSNAESTEESNLIDAAFEDEFGVTLTEVSEVVGVLINYGFKREEPCSVLIENELYQLLKSELRDRDEARLLKTVEIMTLLERKGIGASPRGYTSKDIFPWRYGRNLSYLRRPLALITDDDGQRQFLFGFRHLKTYIDNLLFLIFTGKLPETSSEKMSSFIGTILHEKGTPYRNEVADWLKNNSNLEVIGHEVKIQPGGHIDAGKNYGDVDVMAVDREEKTIYSLECKNIVGARNIHEIKVELDLYLGREGQEAKAKINKHVGRDTYLQEHLESVKKFLKLKEDGYKVVSIVIASDEMPITYIAKESLPLPVISFNQLKEKGKNALKKK